MRLTGKLCLWVIWNNRRDHKDTDWTPVVEFAGHVVECFDDEHGRREVLNVASGRSREQFNPRSTKCVKQASLRISKSNLQCLQAQSPSMIILSRTCLPRALSIAHARVCTSKAVAELPNPEAALLWIALLLCLPRRTCDEKLLQIMAVKPQAVPFSLPSICTV